MQINACDVSYLVLLYNNRCTCVVCTCAIVVVGWLVVVLFLLLLFLRDLFGFVFCCCFLAPSVSWLGLFLIGSNEERVILVIFFFFTTKKSECRMVVRSSSSRRNGTTLLCVCVCVCVCTCVCAREGTYRTGYHFFLLIRSRTVFDAIRRECRNCVEPWILTVSSVSRDKTLDGEKHLKQLFEEKGEIASDPDQRTSFTR